MGQYWVPVNLDKKEYIDPHQLGSGVKLWEQLANRGVGEALIILTAGLVAVGRGGGDFDVDENWHGPERKFPDHNTSPGPMPEEYQAVAQRTIGRWACDRIVNVSDYMEDSDVLPGHRPDRDPPVGRIYGLCTEFSERYHKTVDNPDWQEELKNAAEVGGHFKNVTPDVVRVIEHEMKVLYVGTGWRQRIEVAALEHAGYKLDTPAGLKAARGIEDYRLIQKIVGDYEKHELAQQRKAEREFRQRQRTQKGAV